MTVAWQDSVRTTGWRTHDAAVAELSREDFLDCESTGYLVGETEGRLMLALNRQSVAGSKPMVGETIVIPKSAIVSVKDLRAT